jgi:glycosyltransferase involved in cell wall biosynthesis
MNSSIRRVCVVVPAHNEARRISRCLVAIKDAARSVTVPVDILVVCDACHDDTAAQCTAQDVPVVHIEVSCVGVARRVGIAELLRNVGQPRNVWLANTDADSIVPATWLRDQIELANLGNDAVTGTISLRGHHRQGLLRAFDLRYRQRHTGHDNHHHVHGANLGVRASAYLDIGGFPPHSNHEDVHLVRALEHKGYQIAWPSWLTVETSGRLVGRCEQGFAAYLTQLQHHERRRSMASQKPA